MSEIVSRFGGLGQKVHGSVTGDSVTKLVTKPNIARRGITVANNSGDYSLWVAFETVGKPAPSITSSTWEFSVAANSSITVQIQGGTDVYAMSSSGDSTASNYTCREWM